MKLSMHPSDPLDWVIEGTPQIFEFDLGLNAPYFPLEDQLQFTSRTAALNHFTNTIWKNHSGCKGILYRGSSDFSEHFLWNEKAILEFENYREAHPKLNEDHLKRSFCLEAFVYYFQMLAHKLPDEMPLKLILDPSHPGTKAEKLHLLSPERFEHFEIEHPFLNHSETGILFPSDEMCSLEIFQKIDHFLKTHPQTRAVYEPLLIEQWDGLDELYIFRTSLTDLGERGLLGFIAAGGKVIELETDRGRGI